MTDEKDRPRFREHLHEMREALGGLGHDVKTDVTDAPHVARQGTKNLLARAAGLKKTPIHEWSDPESSERK